MIKNDAGEVAIVHKQPIQKYIKIGRNEYVFIPKRSVSFAWVKEEDVDRILAIEGNCNCPNKSSTRAFRIASEQEHRLWYGLADR